MPPSPGENNPPHKAGRHLNDRSAGYEICIHYLNGTSTSVIERLRDTPIENVRLCSVVVAELYYGAHKSQDPTQNMARIVGFIEGLLILPFDEPCMEPYGQIRAELERRGTPIGGNDLFIAATAAANHCTLVSDNTREFSRVDNLTVENWVNR